MNSHNRPAVRRTALLAALAALFAAAGEALPRALHLNLYVRTGFFTAEAYAGALVFFAGGVLMGAVDPARARVWGLLVGSGPLVHLVFLIFRQGPGNLWPIAILLAAAFGWAPALLGAYLGPRLTRNAARSR